MDAAAISFLPCHHGVGSLAAGFLVTARDRSIGCSGWCLETYSPPAACADSVVADQFDTGPVERFDHFGQGLNHPAHVAFATFHPLYGRHRDAGHPGKLTLIDSEQGARGTHLSSRHHGLIRFQNLNLAVPYILAEVQIS
jgi:hypothetical protein